MGGKISAPLDDDNTSGPAAKLRPPPGEGVFPRKRHEDIFRAIKNRWSGALSVLTALSLAKPLVNDRQAYSPLQPL